MHSVNRHAPFGFSDAALYMLWTAVYLGCFAYVVTNFTPLLVLVFVTVSALGLTITLTLGWVMVKFKNHKERIASLTGALTKAQTSSALVTTTLTAKEEQCEAMQDQLDAANTTAETAGQKNARLEKVVSDLGRRATESDAKRSATETRLHKETAEHVVTKKFLRNMSQTNGSLRQNLAAATSMYDSTNNGLKETRKKLVAQQATTATFTKHLANVTAKGDATRSKLIATSKSLTGQKTKVAVLAQRLQEITAERDAAKTELVAANEEAAAKDVVIAHQRLEVSDGRQLLVARGDANLVLVRMLKKMGTQLKDARFHLELQQLSGKAIKAKEARLQEETNNIQRSMLGLQLLVPTAPCGDAASTTKQDDATATQFDGSTGTLSTVPSPTDTGSSSVSRSGSSGSMSTGGDSDIVQSAVPASPSPAPPSPSHAEGSQAVVHTGAHNRPKRVRRSKRGQHDGQSRSSATKAKTKRAGLFRGYT